MECGKAVSPASAKLAYRSFASASIVNKNDDRKYDDEPTSPKASRQVVNKATKMTPPRVNAPADVSGWLKKALPMTIARI